MPCLRAYSVYWVGASFPTWRRQMIALTWRQLHSLIFNNSAKMSQGGRKGEREEEERLWYSYLQLRRWQVSSRCLFFQNNFHNAVNQVFSSCSCFYFSTNQQTNNKHKSVWGSDSVECWCWWWWGKSTLNCLYYFDFPWHHLIFFLIWEEKKTKKWGG